MDELKVKLLNTSYELLSFPLLQALRLEFSRPMEDSLLSSHIFLVQALDSGSLVHIGDTYNQNVGLVKESFKSVAVDISIVSKDPFVVEVKPTEPLTPGHTYQLVVNKDLPEEFIEIAKITSYGDSSIDVLKVGEFKKELYTIKVLEDSYFNGKSHIVSLEIDGDKIKVDLNKSSKVSFEGFAINLTGTAFLEGEEFLLETKISDRPLDRSFTATIKAASSKDIQALEEDYKVLKTKDIIDYNESVVTENNKEEESFTITYIGKNTILVELEGMGVDEIDFDSYSLTTSEAFGMYTLENLGLYTSEKEYKLDVEVLGKKSFTITLKEV